MKNVKRALSLVIVLALALSMCVVGAGAVKYSDVESTYAYSAEVQFLSDLEIITGYPDGTFQPEGTITRAEAAAVIFRTLAGKESSSENYKGATDFVDVGVDHWACGYINFAVEMGIITGYPDGTFLPEKEISYAEYVTMLARALGLDIGKDLSYPYGYIAEATVENVNYGVDLAAAEPCSRGAVAKLTYNAILDATYRRIANNIYVTEKPTIAQNVLKLELMEGVITSIDDYDWAGDNAVGEGYIRVTDADFADEDFDDNDAFIWEYELDNSYLGKEVKVWFKPDAVTASGDKVYAVIEQKNTAMALPHIVLKGSLADDDDNEITFALNDVDYTAKLDDNCVFVENNEYLGDMNGLFGDEMTAKEFYPAALRMWLPVMYNFIDNDADGKYEFVVRQVYGFSEVTGLTSSRISLEEEGSIDRKNDNGKAYDWNVGLEDVAEEDWVVYYCDGAVSNGNPYAIMQGPDFNSDLYEETNCATFQKMDFGTFAVEEIIDHDRYVFDGTTYRTWSGFNTYYTDLCVGDDIEASIGDEYNLWYTNSFGGIIASAQLADTSDGNFLVVIEMDDEELFGGDFNIKAVLEDGEYGIYTVKADNEENLTINEDSEEVEEIGLMLDNLVVGGLYEYTMNSEGEITALDYYSVYEESVIDVAQDYKDYFRLSTCKLSADIGPDYVIADDAVVFVSEYIDGEWDDTTVYVGTFPEVTDVDAATVVGAKVKKVSGIYETKALHIVIDGDATLIGDSVDDENADEDVDASTGNYLVVIDIDEESFGGDFDIKAILVEDEVANYEDYIYTVKTNEEENLTIYIDSEEIEELGLMQYEIVEGGLYEYAMNDEGKITALNYYGVDEQPAIDITQDYESYYDAENGTLYDENGSEYDFADNAVVFVSEYIDGVWEETTVYIGSFPKVEDVEYAYVVGAKNGIVETKALHVIVEGNATLSEGIEADNKGNDEVFDASTGDFLVVIDMDDEEMFGGEFEIKAVLEDGEADIFTVKSNDEENLTINIDSEEEEEIPLMLENLVIGGVYEYAMNEDGEITALNYYAVSAESVIDINQDYASYYDAESGELYADVGPEYVIGDDTVVFVSEYIEGIWDETNVCIGYFPKIRGYDIGVTVVSAKTESGTEDAQAIHVVINGSAALSSGSEDEDIAGYLRSVKRIGNADDGYWYEYTIAYGDNEAAILKSRVSVDTDDLEEVVEDDDIIDNAYWIDEMSKKASVILFDIARDGTIVNMEAVDELDDIFDENGYSRANDDKRFFAGFMATAIDKTRNRIVVVAVDGVSATARVTGDEEDVTVVGDEEIFSVADDCTVFVFDLDSTNYAKVEIGSLGDIEKLDEDSMEGSLFSFAYDDEEGEITTIFVNNDIIND